MLSLTWETLYMSICVFGIGYWLHYRAFINDLADENDIVQTKKLKKRQKESGKKYKIGNPLVDKWLEFGGGYYGIVALVKLIFIELDQLSEFLSDAKAMQEFFENFGINTLVNMFVEQIMNFVQAIIWPTDLLNKYSVLQIAIFIAITWFFYEMARKFARAKLNQAREEWQ